MLILEEGGGDINNKSGIPKVERIITLTECNCSYLEKRRTGIHRA